MKAINISIDSWMAQGAPDPQNSWILKPKVESICRKLPISWLLLKVALGTLRVQMFTEVHSSLIKFDQEGSKFLRLQVSIRTHCNQKG